MNVLIIDTETTNSIEQPLPYDVGYQIINIPTGQVLCERSFLISEIFLDHELMAQAYFAEKIPQYWEEVKSRKRILKGIFNIRKIIKADLKEYNVSTIGAYNMSFDKRASNNNIRFISGSFLLELSFLTFGTWLVLLCFCPLNTLTFAKKTISFQKVETIPQAQKMCTAF